MSLTKLGIRGAIIAAFVSGAAMLGTTGCSEQTGSTEQASAQTASGGEKQCSKQCSKDCKCSKCEKKAGGTCTKTCDKPSEKK